MGNDMLLYDSATQGSLALASAQLESLQEPNEPVPREDLPEGNGRARVQRGIPRGSENTYLKPQVTER